MATIRTFRAPAAVLALYLPAGQAFVKVDPDAAQMTVTLRTDDDAGAAADAVNRATAEVEGSRCLVDVPEAPGDDISARGITVTRNTAGGGIGIHQTAQVVTGEVVGMTIVNGQVFSSVPASGRVTVLSGIVAEVVVRLTRSCALTAPRPR